MLGPLATFAEPHSYDLCATHALRMTVPQGWIVVRLIGDLQESDETDDLLAVADAVEARRPARGSEAKRRRPTEDAPGPDAADGPPQRGTSSGSRPTLRVLRDQ